MRLCGVLAKDMMMVGGEGCANWTVDTPAHCPGQTDNEYRSEVSMYAVLGSPMMVGTDIRLMTAIMNETLLNKEVLAINQDYEAAVGQPLLQLSPACSNSRIAYIRHLSDGTIAVSVTNLDNSHAANISVCFADVFRQNVCNVSLTAQTSHHACEYGTSYGCVNASAMYINRGCRGHFTCHEDDIQCDMDGEGLHICTCAESSLPTFDRAITQSVRDVWAKTTSIHSDVFTRELQPHDSLLVILSNTSEA